MKKLFVFVAVLFVTATMFGETDSVELESIKKDLKSIKAEADGDLASVERRLSLIEKKPSFEMPIFEGWAETTFGMDLDTNHSGFELDTTARITIPLGPLTEKSVSASEKGEGVTGTSVFYGSKLGFVVSNKAIKDGGANLDTYQLFESREDYYSRPEITAKIEFLNGAYVSIGSSNNIEPNAVDSDDVNYDVSPIFGAWEDEDNDGINDKNDGISVGYDTDMFAFEVTVLNEDGGYVNTDGSKYVYEAWDTDDITNKIIVDQEDEVMKDTAATDDGFILGAKGDVDLGDIFKASFEFGTTAATSQTGSEVFPAIGGLFDLKIPLSEQIIANTTGVKHGLGLTLETKVADMVKVTLPIDGIYKVYGAVATDTVAKTDSTLISYEVRPEVEVEVAGIKAGLNGHYISITEDFTAGADAAKIAYSGYSVGGSVAYEVKNIITPTLSVTSNLGSPAYTASFFGSTGEAKNLGFIVTPELNLKGAKYYDLTVGSADIIADGFDHVDLAASFIGDEDLLNGLKLTFEADIAEENNLFQLVNFEIEIGEELSTVEYTTFTINWSGFDIDTTDAKMGTFYVGAKISI